MYEGAEDGRAHLYRRYRLAWNSISPFPGARRFCSVGSSMSSIFDDLGIGRSSYWSWRM